MELNLPHHLNCVAALPFKCTQRIVHVKPLTIWAKKHQTILPDLWHLNIPDLNQIDYKILVIIQHLVETKIGSVDERQVIDVWCGLEHSRLSTWLLTTSVN